MGHGFSSPRPDGMPGTLCPQGSRDGRWRRQLRSRSAGEGDHERRDRGQAEGREQHETERGDEAHADLGRRDLEPFELGARGGRRRRRAAWLRAGPLPGGRWRPPARPAPTRDRPRPRPRLPSLPTSGRPRPGEGPWTHAPSARWPPPRGRPRSVDPSGRPGPAGRAPRTPRLLSPARRRRCCRRATTCTPRRARLGCRAGPAVDRVGHPAREPTRRRRLREGRAPPWRSGPAATRPAPGRTRSRRRRTSGVTVAPPVGPSGCTRPARPRRGGVRGGPRPSRPGSPR